MRDLYDSAVTYSHITPHKPKVTAHRFGHVW